jgi:zinc transporter 1
MQKELKMGIMLILTTGFFVLEITVGYWKNSIALVADSFHMLSDLMALVVAIYAVRLAKQKGATKYNSFGWQRAEILGALVNGVFLLALCFTLIIQAIQRFVQLEDVQDPELVLIVGSVGLALNITGLILFSDGGHGHSHGGHGASHEKKENKTERVQTSQVPEESSTSQQFELTPSIDQVKEKKEKDLQVENSADELEYPPESSYIQLESGARYVAKKDYSKNKPDYLNFSKGDDILVVVHMKKNFYMGEANGVKGKFDAKYVEIPKPDQEAIQIDPPTSLTNQVIQGQIVHPEESRKKKSNHGHGHGGGSSNIRALFLHALGDGMGSIGVIISSLVIWLTDYSWRFYFDPIVSLFITALIISSVVPLVKETASILLQGVPNFDFEDLKRELKRINGVKGVHELHVWRLADNKLVGSAHIKVDNQEKGLEIAAQVKAIFHQFQVHSSTIQTEFQNLEASEFSGSDDDNDLACLLSCEPECGAELCCELEKSAPTLRKRLLPKSESSTSIPIPHQSVNTEPILKKTRQTKYFHDAGDMEKRN